MTEDTKEQAAGYGESAYGSGTYGTAPEAMTDADIAAMLRNVFSLTAEAMAKANLVGIQANFNIGNAANGFPVTSVIQKVTTEVIDENTIRTTVTTL